jgi:Trypsin-co-occurring domain 1
MTDPENCSTVVIQVNPQSGAVVPQDETDDFIRATQEKLKEVAQLIKTSLQDLVGEISDLSIPPAEVGLEFGIDVGAEGGVPFITKGSVGANFKISVVWRKAKD